MRSTRGPSLNRTFWPRLTDSTMVRGRVLRPDACLGEWRAYIAPTPNWSVAFLAEYTSGLRDRVLGDPHRVDLRDLPVYTIDDPGTVETDDGISVEAAADGSPGLDLVE